MKRFIPAGAGNTAWRPAQCRVRAVHPRWRGEHTVPKPTTFSLTGSSPLARGTLGAMAWQRGLRRFIPAGAGNTGRSPSTDWTPAVHPRWRGEHPPGRSGSAACTGSSPLARGTHAEKKAYHLQERFIPAGAGNTWRGHEVGRTAAVHPRWRGEHSGRQRQQGLSPRFIPAGAGNTFDDRNHAVMPAVHPRWRGEHSSTVQAQMRTRGSSPLARGTRFSVDTSLSQIRFIPAGAGNTADTLHDMITQSVHPRWRGEHVNTNPRIEQTAGSSPLARGTRSRTRSTMVPTPVHPRWRGEHWFPPLPNLFPTRFIPAGAGNTPTKSNASSSKPVHPRWRGEHTPAPPTTALSHGSSPLARGTLDFWYAACVRLRFIPAGAGNTRNSRISVRVTAVHPRWRGEHGAHAQANAAVAGSSPLARGTQGVDAAGGAQQRFIPAGAGNTACSSAGARVPAVHPRWRGEHRIGVRPSERYSGSSPLARGTPTWTHSHPAESRFIPAGAGNTRSAHPPPLPTPVHPRWRGEHSPANSRAILSVGSSPLARGTPAGQPAVGWVNRFIPAGAGNTCGSWHCVISSAVHPRWRGEHVAVKIIC